MLERDKHHNARLVEFFLEKVYGTASPSVEDLIRDNVISGTHLSELAVSKACGIKMHHIGIGQDLVDKSDIKTCTVRSHMKDGKWEIHQTQIRDIGCKKGKLRVIVYNPFFDSWFYFIIPYEMHKEQRHIGLSFNCKTGKPSGKWSEFTVSSWEEFCRK